MVWLVELFMLLVGVVLFLHGWVLTFIGMAIITLCIAGEVYAAIKKVKEENETSKKDLV